MLRYDFSSSLTGETFCLEPLEIGTECIVCFLACGEHPLRIFAALFFLGLTFFLGGRAPISDLIIHTTKFHLSNRVGVSRRKASFSVEAPNKWIEGAEPTNSLSNQGAFTSVSLLPQRPCRLASPGQRFQFLRP